MKRIAARTILAAAAAAILASCSTMRPYYHPVSAKGPLSGNVAVVGCQMKRLAAKKSFSVMNYVYTYKMQWKNGDALLAALRDRLGPEAKSRLPFAVMPDGVFSDYRRMLNASNVYWAEPTVPATGFIPLWDKQGDPERLDPKLLKVLNDNLNCDYYVVFDGDIIDYVSPTLANFMEFTLEYEISMIAYDREGKKVLSKHYDQRFERIEGYSWQDQSAYIGLLGKAVERIQDELNKDIEAGFVPSAEPKYDPKKAI